MPQDTSAQFRLQRDFFVFTVQIRLTIKLRHAGATNVNREAELDRPSHVACSDFVSHSSVHTIYDYRRDKDKHLVSEPRHRTSDTDSERPR